MKRPSQLGEKYFPPVTMVDINMEYNEKSENYTQRIDLVYTHQKYTK